MLDSMCGTLPSHTMPCQANNPEKVQIRNEWTFLRSKIVGTTTFSIYQLQSCSTENDTRYRLLWYFGCHGKFEGKFCDCMVERIQNNVLYVRWIDNDINSTTFSPLVPFHRLPFGYFNARPCILCTLLIESQQQQQKCPVVIISNRINVQFTEIQLIPIQIYIKLSTVIKNATIVML